MSFAKLLASRLIACLAAGGAMSDDAYRYSDPAIGYLLLMTLPWKATAISLHALLSEAATVARRFVRQGMGTRAEGPRS